MLADDALIAYPTDSGYALGCRFGSTTGPERIRTIRRLDDRHHFTLVCSQMAQLGHVVLLDNGGGGIFGLYSTAAAGNDWAEYLTDLECARSRRRHPSNREPAWAKDGGYDGTEWDI